MSDADTHRDLEAGRAPPRYSSLLDDPYELSSAPVGGSHKAPPPTYSQALGYTEAYASHDSMSTALLVPNNDETTTGNHDSDVDGNTGQGGRTGRLSSICRHTRREAGCCCCEPDGLCHLCGMVMVTAVVCTVVGVGVGINRVAAKHHQADSGTGHYANVTTGDVPVLSVPVNSTITNLTNPTVTEVTISQTSNDTEASAPSATTTTTVRRRR